MIACLRACLSGAGRDERACVRERKRPDAGAAQGRLPEVPELPDRSKAKAACTAKRFEGEFKLGNKTTELVNPTILQGGLPYIGTTTLTMIPPRFGAEQVSKSPQPIPGGLTGISPLLGGEANATAEQAGPIVVTSVFLGFGHDIAVEFPIKIHLENENLGPNCYIGSDEEPVVLRLTDGVTSPPEGVEPMEGKIGDNKGLDKGRLIAFFNNTLVDNTFAVPAAKGCGEGAARTGPHRRRERGHRPSVPGGHQPRDPDRQPVHDLLELGRKVRQEGDQGQRKGPGTENIARRREVTPVGV